MSADRPGDILEGLLAEILEGNVKPAGHLVVDGPAHAHPADIR